MSVILKEDLTLISTNLTKSQKSPLWKLKDFKNAFLLKIELGISFEIILGHNSLANECFIGTYEIYKTNHYNINYKTNHYNTNNLRIRCPVGEFIIPQKILLNEFKWNKEMWPTIELFLKKNKYVSNEI